MSGQGKATAREQKAAPFAGLPAIFRDCCYRGEELRYDLSRPFAQGEYLYATDGRIAVRIPACAADEATAELARRQAQAGTFPDMAAMWAECWHSRSERVPLPPEGADEGPSVEVAGRTFSAAYLRILRHRRFAELFLPEAADGAANFAVGDIEGLLMPMTRPGR